MPGSAWVDRVFDSLDVLGLAACVCFAGELIFEIPSRRFDPEPTLRLRQTLPVCLFFWGAGLTAVMFLLSWFLTVLRPLDLEEPAY